MCFKASDICFLTVSSVILILLYKLLPVDYTFLGKDVLSFTEDIRNLYEDTNKFFVPNSLEELKEYLEKMNLNKKGILE